ncbi:MAG: 6-pyruvoyl tetrahydrobiopterin synthase [Myxococcales bacterium]|nr:6-pyruvoyl tetrahydrobiopterin synthase [Myxococcales bacterium]
MTAPTERFGIRLDKQYFNFGSAHFLIFSDGTREELHGHNWQATLELDGALDSGHVVADFIVVKPIFKACCDELDHRTLLPLHNPLLRVETRDDGVHAWFGADHWLVPARDVRLLDLANTSSELLARWLCERLLARIAAVLPALRIERVLVTVQESPGQSAVYERRGPA